MNRFAFLTTVLIVCMLIGCTTFYQVRQANRQKVLQDSQSRLEQETTNNRDAINQKFLNHIKFYLGTSYKFGGNSCDGMDCSGFVSAIFFECFNIELPHNAYQIYQNCQEIPKHKLKLGDLVFFRNRRKIDHVGIYLSKDYFVHASVNYGVIVSKLSEKYYRSRYFTAGRIVDSRSRGTRK
jgi:cell wall-associated NlpC family hydrolase